MAKSTNIRLQTRMQWLSIVTSLALVPSTLGRSINSGVQRRQSNTGYQYINYTQFHGSNEPVTVGVSVNGGGRNATAPLLYGW